MAFLQEREKRAVACSAGDFSGCRTGWIGGGVDGSGAIGNGVMNLISPLGGPLPVAMLDLSFDDWQRASLLTRKAEGEKSYLNCKLGDAMM